MSNTLKLNSIIVCLLMLVNTNFSYSSDFEDNNFGHQMQVPPNDLEQYNDFINKKLNQLQDIEKKIPNIFDNNQVIGNRVLEEIQPVKNWQTMTNLAWTNCVNNLSEIRNNNETQLSPEQKNIINVLITLCDEIRNSDIKYDTINITQHTNDLEQYNNFFQQKLNILNNIATSIPTIFNNNDAIKDKILYIISNLVHNINLSFNNKIDRDSFLIFLQTYINNLRRIGYENQLSTAQEQKLQELINLYNEIKNELKDDDNNTDNSDAEDSDEFSDSSDSDNEEPGYLGLN